MNLTRTGWAAVALAGLAATCLVGATGAAAELGAADGGSAVAVGPGKCAPKHDKATPKDQRGPGDKDKKGKDDKNKDKNKKRVGAVPGPARF